MKLRRLQIPWVYRQGPLRRREYGPHVMRLWIVRGEESSARGWLHGETRFADKVRRCEVVVVWDRLSHKCKRKTAYTRQVYLVLSSPKLSRLETAYDNDVGSLRPAICFYHTSIFPTQPLVLHSSAREQSPLAPPCICSLTGVPSGQPLFYNSFDI